MQLVADSIGDVEILVAEDEPLIREMIANVLELLPYRFCLAIDGDQALARIDAGVRPRLLITDVCMPGSLDGFALARAACARLPDLQVLVISGYFPAFDERDDLACMHLLPKPFRMRQLSGAISALLH